MGFGRATVYGVLDALPFALGLGFVLLAVGDEFARGEIYLVSLLLGAGVGALLAMVSGNRYVADGTRFWLLRSFTDVLLWWA